MTRSVLVVVASAGLAVGAVAESDRQAYARCSGAVTREAEVSLGPVRDWAALHRHYRQYARCETDRLTQHYSRKVIELLVRQWNEVDEFGRLRTTDAVFGRWVLGHVGATTPSADLERIWRSALDCVDDYGVDEDLCDDVMEASRRALLRRPTSRTANPVALAGVLSAQTVRVAFARDGSGWSAFPSPDLATVGLKVNEEMNEWVRSPVRHKYRWTACSGGTSLGRFESELADSDLANELGAHAPISGTKVATAAGPTLLTTLGRCDDPEDWRLEKGPAQVTPALAKALRAATKRIFRCEAEGKRAPYAFRDSEIVVAESRVSRFGDHLVTLFVNPRPEILGPCRHEMLGTPWARHTFALPVTGGVYHLGWNLQFVAAGDCDGDGRSEILFAFEAPARGGYVLAFDRTRRTSWYGWVHH